MSAYYNSYQTHDTSGNNNPYMNSLIEFGMFNKPGSYSETNYDNAYSLNTNLYTNNGIASLDNSVTDSSGNIIYGLKLNSAGIYKINLNFNPVYTPNGDGQSGRFSYAFSTAFMNNADTTNISNNNGYGLFGGYVSSNTYAFDPIGQTINGTLYNNNSDPGILFWNNSSFSVGTSSYNPFIQLYGNSSNQGYLFGNFPTYVNNGGLQYPFIMTGEMIFTTSNPTTIYLNMTCDFDMFLPNCYFTLQLLSTNSFQNYT
jgi:hypothetical protein